MQIKQDGHVKFYTENEFTTFANKVGLQLDKSYITKIRFQRKEAEKYKLLLNMISDEVRNGYEIQIVDDEIFITEQVLNLSFVKILQQKQFYYLEC